MCTRPPASGNLTTLSGDGALAQLVEHHAGSVRVRSSDLLGSTITSLRKRVTLSSDENIDYRVAGARVACTPSQLSIATLRDSTTGNNRSTWVIPNTRATIGWGPANTSARCCSLSRR